MRVLGLLKADQQSEAGVPPSAELVERMGKFTEMTVVERALIGGHP
jgi:hypothetical protein